ncbi:MAG: helix-turn-helix transcriptional regulator [Levilactobacillus sp.]|jgi:transcriptional regulator with XRE-family HTH domain|uniref:helix-turn-helix domain-containing protein n=1 Tax=Levilactobacillus sp. TaxID=2767919 RepID=UPI00258E2D3D|nr:helix-turn-helix transcriptional regulator [Levilactobacillus sp.]MCH4123662.1 helix-turn-helix transcriptional regulator [Levilactobacillus sp.]MCI1553760.1 helix-turn-helix transcriptional regulator [Levilactobacillus sp.]MCI1599527.1 helix-turn-helix transcriptional regulator [Levilactobacillus sp.]
MSEWTWENFKPTIENIAPQEMSIIDTLSALQVERIRRGISQKEFAKRIGMKQPQLAKLENLDSMPTLRTLDRYAAGLGLRITMSLTPRQPSN